MIILAFAGGILGLIVSLSLRRNTPKARQWENTNGILDESFVYMSLPGFSLLMLGLGFAGFTVPLIGGNLSWLGVIGALIGGATAAAGAVLTFWGLFTNKVPTWALPRWRQ